MYKCYDCEIVSTLTTHYLCGNQLAGHFPDLFYRLLSETTSKGVVITAPGCGGDHYAPCAYIYHVTPSLTAYLTIPRALARDIVANRPPS